MNLRRPWGVRPRLVAAMVAVAVTAVLLATLASSLAVDDAVERFGKKDLAQSARHSAAVAGDFYTERGRWDPADVRELGRVEQVQGHTVVVRDLSGRVVAGSDPDQARERAVAVVTVDGRAVGTVSLAHLGGGYLRALTQELNDALRSHYIVAGLLAATLGVLVAVTLGFALAEPVRRLTRAAAAIEAGDLDTSIEGDRGAAELRQLGRMMGRVVATLKREEEIRRQTISDLAHELRTPMAGLRGRIEAAQDGVLTDMPALLESMHADVLRLGRLMEDVERLAAAQQPGLLLEREEIDLAELARVRARAFEDFYRTAGIRLMTDLEPATTLGDPERLGQVIDNLLSNALRYTDRDGRVILRVLATRSQAIVEVADTGIGIPPEELPRIFDRFFRSDRSRSRATGGSGLGLALVHELVRAHDGRVDVESRPGAGSRFRVHLPAGALDTESVLEVRERPAAAAPDGTPVFVAHVTRDLVPGDWRAVEKALVRRIRGGLKLLAFELDADADVTPQAVTTLISAQAELKGRGGRLVIVCPEDSPARQGLEVSGADRALPILDDEHEAIGALVDEPAAAGA